MATGVKPRDDETMLTKTDLEAIQEAMRSKKFRDMFAEYCDEVRDPANQALYQKEMTQLEKERGYDITFINPKGGYVIKTSVAGDRKAFINICSNDNIDKPSYSVENVDGQKGMNWKIPYSLIPPREDYDNKKQRCVIYDVVFHPDTLRMAEVNEQFREIVNKTAFDGLRSAYNIHLDSNNCRFPKSTYKGMLTAAVLRKEDPLYKPSTEEKIEELSPELLEKLYPQHTYPTHLEESFINNAGKLQEKRKPIIEKKEFIHSSNKGYTVPKYVLKQQKNVDLQDYTYNKDCKQLSAIPSHLVVEINLPLISSTKDCILDVNEKSLTLIAEKPAKYKLDLTLPYPVDDKCGNAKFDKTKHMLIVTLPVNRNIVLNKNSNMSKIDSGVESEENSRSQSEEDSCKEKHITEILSEKTVPDLNPPILEKENVATEELFLQGCIGYILPSYTHNFLDDVIAFTFHVKNTEPDSVVVTSKENVINIKFTSIGSGFVPAHHAAVIVFEEGVKFKDVSGEAWDNNVILQLELAGNIPQTFKIGLSKDSMTTEHFDVSQFKKTPDVEVAEIVHSLEEVETPIVEVTNLGSETNIVVSSTNKNEESTLGKNNDKVWTESGHCETGAKSILRKSISMMRSISESSMGDVASSMDYISSDCIPEESSLKKTVRFNDVIARQFYRYNSSIEGQKRKNQRKKSKKRNQERCKSESEAEEESNFTQMSKPRLKSALKLRRDSGLADTSDAEVECRNLPSDSELSCDSNNYNEKTEEDKINANSEKSSPLKMVDKNGNTNKTSESYVWKIENDSASNKKKMNPVTCDNIKHNTEFYNPEKLNKGQYQEVMFKNDLIFDLDM